MIAVCIAGYTLLDDRGIEHADAIAYLELVVGIPGLVYLAAIWRRRGERPSARRCGRRPSRPPQRLRSRTSSSSLAFDLAKAAPVAAVRETSVVIAVALAAIFLHERVGTARLAGAVLVVAGVALLSLLTPHFTGLAKWARGAHFL